MWLRKVIKVLESITKKDIIYGLIIFFLVGCLSTAVRRCSDTRSEYKNNIAALNDTIKYYQDKNGNLVATKLAFESDIKTLKSLNEELYNQLKDLKAKGNITSGTLFSGVIENPTQDTTWIVKHDTIIKGFNKMFEFDNDYRLLEGIVSYQSDTIGINIIKDQVVFDYVVAIDDKNNIMIKSSNPYVKYNQITGFQLPKEKQKHWSLGVFGKFGWEPVNNDNYSDLGIRMDYHLKRFSIGPTIFYENNFKTKDKSIYLGANVQLNILEW